jgi:hypothetical protein
MPRLIPKSIDDRLSMFRVLLERWEADPGLLGLSEEQIAMMRGAVEAADAAHAAAMQARQAAEAATLMQTVRLNELSTLGATLVATIRLTARTAPTPIASANVLEVAGLPPISKPTYTSVPPPQAENVTLTPRADGAITLAWRSDLKRATYYRVERVLHGAAAEEVAEWPSGQAAKWPNGQAAKCLEPATRDPRPDTCPRRELIATVRGSSFIDDDLPVGFTRVEYLVTPVKQRGGGRRIGTRQNAIDGPPSLVTYTAGARPQLDGFRPNGMMTAMPRAA